MGSKLHGRAKGHTCPRVLRIDDQKVTRVRYTPVYLPMCFVEYLILLYTSVYAKKSEILLKCPYLCRWKKYILDIKGGNTVEERSLLLFFFGEFSREQEERRLEERELTIDWRSIIFLEGLFMLPYTLFITVPRNMCG